MAACRHLEYLKLLIFYVCTIFYFCNIFKLCELVKTIFYQFNRQKIGLNQKIAGNNHFGKILTFRVTLRGQGKILG